MSYPENPFGPEKTHHIGISLKTLIRKFMIPTSTPESLLHFLKPDYLLVMLFLYKSRFSIATPVPLTTLKSGSSAT